MSEADSEIPAIQPGRSPLSRRMDRRATLAGFGIVGLGAAAAMLTACTSGASAESVDQAVKHDELGPLYTETVSLISSYDQTIAREPALAMALGRLRDEHRRHAIALAGLMGALMPSISKAPNASGESISPSLAATEKPTEREESTTAGLSAAEKKAHVNMENAALAAPADRVATLAAIAACRSTHVAALGAMR